MKKNIRSIIAVLLIIFSFTFLFENSNQRLFLECFSGHSIFIAEMKKSALPY